jgi:flavin-binding protein dodecin
LIIRSSVTLWEVIVAGTVARVTEISARSDTSFEDAVKVGLDRANSTLRGVTSAWVKEQSVEVQNGSVVAYRVNLLVTFVLE